MKLSLLTLAVAVGLSTGLAVAYADDKAPAQLAAQPTATANAAETAYQAGVNPLATVPSTGVYDNEDRVTGPNGLPLPGYANYFGPTDSD